MSYNRIGPVIAVACAQLAPHLGALEDNRAAAATAIEDLALRGAQLIVLPELCTTGYAFHDAAEASEHAEPAIGPTLTTWCELAARHGLVIVGGFCERGESTAVHNSAAVVDERGVVVIYRKTHLWDRVAGGAE